MLKPIKPKRISDQVFEQLKDLIFRGHLKPGEQLMTERELAQALGVSRPTVREAINKLVAIRLLEQRQGQGTFVNSPANIDRNPLSAVMGGEEVRLEDLLEVRLGLECNAVALAARRATDDDIRELEKSLAEMAADIAEGRLGTDADVSFHMAIAYASKNTVQVHIMRSFYNLLFYGIKENLLRLYSSPDDLKRIISQHTAIVEAVRRHNPEGAFDAMRNHIRFVLDFFSRKDSN